MIKRGLILFLLLVPIAYGQWFTDAEEVNINLRIEGEIEVIAEGGNPNIQYVTSNLTLFPIDNFRQDYSKNLILPPSSPKNGYIVFRWEDPDYTSYKFIVDSDITLYNKQIQIKDRVSFPIRNIPDDVKKYIEISPTIDFEDLRIKKLANKLAEGEDDLFVVVSKLADWTQNNIQYNLSTLTAQTTEKASWVLENRMGVCDELTNLFIAMGRSLGIPVRFVSGISYTESPLFPERWGLHGWSEVYFPGYGWVDYDVTYGEYGFLSPTHIKLKDGIDATEPSSRYNWLGRDVNIKTNPLDFKTTLKDFNGEIEDNIVIETTLEKYEIGMESYNLVNVKVTNLEDYYTAEEIRIFSTNDVEILGGNRQMVLLKPFEEKTIYFPIKVPDLEEGFYYIYPVQAINSRNITSKNNFTVRSDGAFFTEEEILKLVELRQESEVKKYSKDLSISCQPLAAEFYTYENTIIICKLINLGNVFFENLQVCFRDECETLDLGISNTVEVDFELSGDESGKVEEEIVARSDDAVKSTVVKYSVLDSPKIKVDNIIIPAQVKYKEIYDLDFLLSKESFSNIYNVTIFLKHDGYSKEWFVPVMDKDRKFTIQMKGSSLYEGENELEISVQYNDKNGNEFSTQESVVINLNNLNPIEKVLAFSNKIGRKIIFTESGWFEYILISVIAFIAIFLIIVKRNKKRI